MRANIVNNYIASSVGLKTKSYHELRPGLYEGPLDVDQFREEARSGMKLVFKGQKIYIDYQGGLGIQFESSIFGLREIPGSFTLTPSDNDLENSVKEQKILDGYIDVFFGKKQSKFNDLVATNKKQDTLYYLTTKSVSGLEKVELNYYGLLYNTHDFVLPRLIEGLSIYKLGTGNYVSGIWRGIR